MWFWLAIGVAVLGALEIVISKYILNRVSSATLLWTSFTFSIPFVVLLTLKEGIPSLNQTFWIAVFVSSLFFIISRILQLNVIRENLLSKIIPLSAFIGVFTYLIGLVLLSETVRIVPFLGMLTTIFGAYILNTDQAKEDLLKPFKLLFTNKISLLFLFAIFLVSITAVLDKMAILNTTPMHPVFTILVEQIIMSTLLFLYLIKRESKTYFLEIKQNFWWLFLESLMSLAVGILIFIAYTDGPVSLILSLKRLQIFFVLILGYLFLKDKPTKHSWIATLIMILGAILIKIG